MGIKACSWSPPPSAYRLHNAGADDGDTAPFQIGTNAGNAVQINVNGINDGTGAPTINDSNAGNPSFLNCMGGVNVDCDAEFTIFNVSEPDLSVNQFLFVNNAIDTNIVGAIDLQNVVGLAAGAPIAEGAQKFDDPTIEKVFAIIDDATGTFLSVMVIFDGPVEEIDPGNGTPGRVIITIDGVDVVIEDFVLTGNMGEATFPVGIDSAGVINGNLDFDGIQDTDGDQVPVPENGLENGIQRTNISDNGDPVVTFMQDDAFNTIEGIDEPRAIFVQKIDGQLTGDDLGSAMIRAFVIAPSPVPTAGPNSVCTFRHNGIDNTTQLQFGLDIDDSDPAEDGDTRDQDGVRSSILKAIRANEQSVDLTMIARTSSNLGWSPHPRRQDCPRQRGRPRELQRQRPG